MRICLILIPLTLTGCVHSHLQHNTIHQAGTLSNIYEQQVLDNLAKFVVDPQAVPDFAIASSGSSKVSDKGNISAAKPLNPFFQTIGLGYDRSSEGSWALAPVTDPTRLKRMRCAYQRAIGCPDETCVKCCELEKEWKGKPDTIDEDGVVTTHHDCNEMCAKHSDWFCYGPRCEVPNDCCQIVGEYCGTYVWVPKCYRHELAKLVLAIMEYAVNEPATPATKKTKQVVVHVTADGTPAAADGAELSILADVPIDLGPARTLQLLGLPVEEDELQSEKDGQRNAPVDPVLEQFKIEPGRPPRPAKRALSPFDQRILFDVNAPVSD